MDLNKKTTLHGTLYKMFLSHSLIVDKKLLKKAIKEAFVEYESYKIKIKSKAMEFQNFALLNKIPVIILAGRPYHIDNELNHGIDSLISDMGAVVLWEDAFTNQGKIISTKILNQFPKIGIVGELYAKYCYLSNNNLEKYLQQIDCEYYINGLS